MNEHRFTPHTRVCCGCAISERQAEDRGVADCPAFYRDLGDGLSVVITTDERLMVMSRGTVALSVPQGAMFDLRDAIDEGVNELREGGRSTAAPN